MIEISKGNKKIKVSQSAFDNFYKDNGWEVAKKKATPTNEKVEEKVEEPVEESKVEEESTDEWDDVIQEEDELEKPLNEMSKKELVEKAKSLGIDTTPGYNSNQLRDMIREVQAQG